MQRLLIHLLVSLILVVYLADSQLKTLVANQLRNLPEEVSLYSLSNIEVHDGDTLTADVKLGFNVVLTHQTIRFKDFDAWEISTGRRTVKVTPEETQKGIKARDFVVNLLKKSQFKITDGKYDIYNRIVSDVYWLDTKQSPSKYVLLANTLREQGFERTNDNSSSKN